LTTQTSSRDLAATVGSARIWPTTNLAFAATLGFAVLGFLLRIAVAKGPLGSDEIWSIQNLAPLTSPWQVFWGISHDNNHFLNSLWLYFVNSPAANVLLLRGPALVMGAAMIPLMALLGARHSPLAAIAAAALTAASFFFVNYGAFARGYAGQALALAVAFAALEKAIVEPNSRQRYVLASAAGFGSLSHLATLPALALYVLICFVAQRRRLGAAEPAVAATSSIFWPSALAVLPALASVAAGYVVMGGFTIGQIDPYDSMRALKAMALVVFSVCGLPGSTPFVLVAIASPIVIAVAIGSGLVLAERRFAYALVLLATPAAVFILRPINTDIPRYYLVCALFLVLLIAEVVGGLWRLGGWRRNAAALALAAMIAGSLVQFSRFEASMDEGWPNALAAIANSNETKIATTLDPGFDKFVVQFNQAHRPALDLIAKSQWCAIHPQWLIVDLTQAPMPATQMLRGDRCQLNFDYERGYVAGGFAPTAWALYRLGNVVDGKRPAAPIDHRDSP
jgi:hypothetical protein